MLVSDSKGRRASILDRFVSERALTAAFSPLLLHSISVMSQEVSMKRTALFQIVVVALVWLCAGKALGIDLPGCDSKPPWEPRETVSRNSTTVTHYVMKRDVGPNVGRAYESCLHVSAPDSTWWVPRLADSIFGIGEFIDDDHLLVIADTITYSSTYILDLETRSLVEIGGGKGSYIREGPNKGMVLLSGQKRYQRQGGAYWVSVVVDLTGELIEFMPGHLEPCLPISEILRPNESTTKLRQPLTQCILVGS